MQFKYDSYRGPPVPERANTFADVHGFGYDDTGPYPDFHPITTDNPPVSRAAGNATFQVRPSRAACDPRLPQATTPAGLRVGLADGSVRVLRPGIEPSLFWGAVTPAAGEVVDLD